MPVLTAPAAPTHDLGGTRFTSLATPSRGCTDTAVWQVPVPANGKTIVTATFETRY